MKAIVLNCSLKSSPDPSSTGALADVLCAELAKQDVYYEIIRVADFLATGNEDGAKHVIGEMTAELMELGFTVPGHAYTYFNNGVAMGDDYKDTDDQKAKQRAEKNAATAAHTIVSVARALKASPIPSES